MKILHIVGHLGGGVKTVLLTWALNNKSNTHIFTCFGYSDEFVIKTCKENQIELYSDVSYEKICEKIEEVDIVIIHYWNYPPLIDFLVTTTLPPCRLIAWCHMSGIKEPYVIPHEIIKITDKFIFSSPVSFKAGCIQSLSDDQKQKLDVIWSTGGTEKYKNVKLKQHNGYNIIYVGTLDFAKLRHDFIDICHLIYTHMPNVNFIICGTGSSSDELKQQVSKYNMDNIFTFTGYVDDLTKYLEIADVCLYPLSETHFGTAEQALGEIMSIGIVPIVKDNPSEKEIITNSKDGFMFSFDNQMEIVQAIQFLYINNDIYQKMSDASKEKAKKLYSLETMINKWNNILNEIINYPKIIRQWDSYNTFDVSRGTQMFLESLGEYSRIFKEFIKYKKYIIQLLNSNDQWKSKTKGSINHYLKHFPDDEQLQEWNNFLDDENDDRK